jgi:hypothetical protein
MPQRQCWRHIGVLDLLPIRVPSQSQLPWQTSNLTQTHTQHGGLQASSAIKPPEQPVRFRNGCTQRHRCFIPQIAAILDIQLNSNPSSRNTLKTGSLLSNAPEPSHPENTTLP